MESYKRHRLGGLAYQLDYYRNLQNKALASHEETAQALNIKAQNEYQGKLQEFSQRGQTAKTVSTTATTLGTTIGSIGAKNIGKNLWTRFKTARALDSGEKGPTGLTDARYDSDLHNVMYENQEATRDAPEPVEGSEPTPAEEAPPMTEGEIDEFADPSISGGGPSTFEPVDMPEPLDAPAMTGEEIEGFRDPFTQVARFGAGGTRDQIFDARMGQVDEMAENFQGQIERGEIVPRDLDADPEEGMNFFQKALGRMVFGTPQKSASQLQQEQLAADYSRVSGDVETGGEDVGVPLDPETLRPIGQEAPSGVEEAGTYTRDPELQAMIDAGNRAGDAENEIGDQNLLDEFNNMYGTNYDTLEGAYGHMNTPQAEIVESQTFPAKAEVVGQEGPPTRASQEYEVDEIEGPEEFPEDGPPPPKPPRVQSLRTQPVEEAPEVEPETAPEVETGGLPEAADDPEVAEMGEEFFRGLASQQASTADSTLARMGLGGLEHPAAGSQEESAQPSEQTFEPDAPEAEEPSRYTDLPDFGEPEEEAGEEAGEAAGETIGETAGELGAEEGIEAGLTTAAETADLVAAETAAIPGLDIATAIIGGILTVGGIGYSIYEATHEKNDAPKAPQPVSPTPVAPAPPVAGHYVGASADNYFNANQHFQGF